MSNREYRAPIINPNEVVPPHPSPFRRYIRGETPPPGRSPRRYRSISISSSDEEIIPSHSRQSPIRARARARSISRSRSNSEETPVTRSTMNRAPIRARSESVSEDSSSSDEAPVARAIHRVQIRPRRLPRRSRTFTLLNIETGESSGRYRGYLPAQAASKCFTYVARNIRNSTGRSQDNITTEIFIRETTRHSKRKIYKYRCERRRIDHPIDRRIGGVNVRFQYHNSIKRLYQYKQKNKNNNSNNDNNDTKETSPLDITMVYPTPILIDDLVIEI